jgi:tripartite-type tricarboxylate transporter receptor subunit TctC
MMKLPRREFLRLTGAAAVVPTLPGTARADAYPSRPVHIVTGYPAGTAPDIIARLIAQPLSDRLGQQFIVDNRPAAADNIGTEIVARAPPDGYTLLMTLSTNAINATLYNNLNFDFARDFIPIAGIGRAYFVFVVNPDFPVKTFPELVAYAKANPGRVNFATNGLGTGAHVAAEMLMMMTDAKLTVVPYKSNFFADLLGGQVQLADPPLSGVIGYIKEGKLRALAVTTAKRANALPDVPAVAELLPGYDAYGWFGLSAPKDTPADVVATLAKATLASVADPAFQSRLSALGTEPMPLPPAEFGKFIAEEIEKWGKVVKFANLKPE